jgi:hypothetical protein
LKQKGEKEGEQRETLTEWKIEVEMKKSDEKGDSEGCERKMWS